MRRAFLVIVVAVVIRGGRVLDGTGSPFFHADVAIDGGRIGVNGKRAADSGEPTGLLLGEVLTPRASNGTSSR